jgi:hypothetical protein
VSFLPSPLPIDSRSLFSFNRPHASPNLAAWVSPTPPSRKPSPILSLSPSTTKAKEAGRNGSLSASRAPEHRKSPSVVTTGRRLRQPAPSGSLASLRTELLLTLTGKLAVSSLFSLACSTSANSPSFSQANRWLDPLRQRRCCSHDSRQPHPRFGNDAHCCTSFSSDGRRRFRLHSHLSLPSEVNADSYVPKQAPPASAATFWATVPGSQVYDSNFWTFVSLPLPLESPRT